LKGVNRHSFHPETGRALNREISISDIKLIKSMNMNAVRMSHYPPDKHFLELTDELGLYVINELPGWSKPSYDTPTARRLVKQLVTRDQNHPSILLWANSNEGGWNTDVDGDYELYDLQKRNVIHPWSNFGGIDTKHYPTWGKLNSLQKQGDLFMPTEFLHGLYDGGIGAGMSDYWNFIEQSSNGAGGFLWVLKDEGIARPDLGSNIYDTDGNHGADGIVGPFDEKEGSYYTVRDIWSPVQILAPSEKDTLADNFDGTLTIFNKHDFITLEGMTLESTLINTSDAFSRLDKNIITLEKIQFPKITAGDTGEVSLNLPDDWQQADILKIEVRQTNGDLVRDWTWPINGAASTAKQTRQHYELKYPASDSIVHNSEGGKLFVSAGDLTVTFDEKTGLLIEFSRGKLNKKQKRRGDLNTFVRAGPFLIKGADPLVFSHDETATEIQIIEKTQQLKVMVKNPVGGLNHLVWTIHKSGYLSVEAGYTLSATVPYHGILFKADPEQAIRKTWQGKGPYRTWRNRQEGMRFGLWEGVYNDARTGADWRYPEYKGYFANLNWLRINLLRKGQQVFSTPDENLYVRVFEPKNALQPKKHAFNEFAEGLAFMKVIPAVGTKFHVAQKLGPQSEPVHADGSYTIKLDIF